MSTVATKTFDCRSGLIRRPWGYSVWIRSPRTGKTLTISDRQFVQLPRLRGRVVQAISMGRPTTFTLDELRTIAGLASL